MTAARPGGDRGGGPTLRRMMLGARLRRLRVSRMISVEVAAYHIGASGVKVSCLELGRVRFDERDVAGLLDLYGVHGEVERGLVLALAREANQPGWWHGYSDVLPSWFQPFLGLEDAAELIRTYEVEFVPGLLQTEEYARAVISTGCRDTSAQEVERLVDARMSRQQVLTRENPPRLWAVVDEAALRRPIGGPAVMRAQLEHLIVAATRPNLTLQVTPSPFGGHAAADRAFSILRFPVPDVPDVVYLEQRGGAIYWDRREEVGQYIDAANRLCIDSSTPGDTIDLLARIGREMI